MDLSREAPEQRDFEIIFGRDDSYAVSSLAVDNWLAQEEGGVGAVPQRGLVRLENYPLGGLGNLLCRPNLFLESQ